MSFSYRFGERRGGGSRGGQRITGVVLLALLTIAGKSAQAQGPENVLVVVNDASTLSRQIGEYYADARSIPENQVCHIRSQDKEWITRSEYDRAIAAPTAACLRGGGLAEQILYIVTTGGVPLTIEGTVSGQETDRASVDSELSLLYGDMQSGRRHAVGGKLPNPFFRKRDDQFTHRSYPIYLVARLAGYDLESVKALIGRAKQARNRGKFVIDLKAYDDEPGNNWLRTAALLLPQDRVVLDESINPVYGQKDVIGYAGWGSNDPNHHERFVGFEWLPGAIATEFVSTNARTFERPPEGWQITNHWRNQATWFAGAPQTLTADYLDEGASAATGHVDEPYLDATPRPESLLPAYFSGRNLVESYYLSIPYLSWQNVVIGDPLMSLGKPPSDKLPAGRPPAK